MSKKPFPFSVCKECCVPSGGGETVIINEGGYAYVVENIDEYLAVIQLQPNTVTYAYGTTTQSKTLEFDLIPKDENDTSEETVLILDLSASVTAPTVSFSSGVKWLNGAPPEIEAGKVYMFSFVRVKRSDTIAYFYLGVGGEFA